MTGFGTTKGSGAVKGVKVSSASQKRIKDRMAANSLAWHKAATQEEKDLLHAKNAALADILGEGVSFDAGSGMWSGSADSDGVELPDPPGYVSGYQPKLDAAVEKAGAREAFSYDAEKDPAYQQYKESYTRAGQRAMQDTLGQVSARTGGLASSYAGSAAQQAYDGYMAGLAAEIPALRKLAYEMYRDEGDKLREDVELLAGLVKDEYGRYGDQLAQYNKDRDFAYGQYRDSVADGRYQEEMEYKRGRDRVSDERADREDEEEREDRDYKRALEKARTLAASGDFSGYADVGYSEEEIERMRKYFYAVKGRRK